jgi:N-acetylneuraminic acid mutarotase
MNKAAFNGIVAAWALSAAAAPSASAQGVWANKAAMPGGARENIGVAAFEGRMYVFGGSAHADTRITRTEAYDPGTDRWSTRAPMPSGSHHVGITLVNGKIYTFGGFTGQAHTNPVDNAFEYDPKTDHWRALARLTSSRGSPSAVALDGKIHVIGGRGADNKTIGNHDVFDPATGQWSTRAPLAKPRDHLGLIVVGGKIHAIGGRPVSFASNETLHEIYDPGTDSWVQAAPMPTPHDRASEWCSTAA